ncbi:ROK family protein [Paenibacillus pasadenensis]|uniref:ROK family protein n=1 Tax=Paenibacillus TaxID=44249 RepID=UPI0005BB55F8|nr:MULTISPECIES: ROK family protein [Paenibacillus]QGG58394.1 ROK family protein [Paenibacillus sp. B01]
MSTLGKGTLGQAEGEWLAGIDVGGTKTLMMLSPIASGGPTIQRKIGTRTSGSPAEFIDWLFAELKQFGEDSGIPYARLVGVGIGFPGIIQDARGILLNAPAFHWPQLDIRPLIRKVYAGRIYLDNDVNLAAIGEHAEGAAQGCDDFAMITVGTGIGCALFLDGRLYGGHEGGAGEIGHLIVGDAGLEGRAGSDPNEFGVLEQMASGTGIALQARRRFSEHDADPSSAVLELAGGDQARIEARHVLEAAKDDDPEALRVMDRALGYMARCIANIVGLLNPALVILGGGVAAADPDYYLGGIAERLAGLTAVPVALAPARLGNEAGATGALVAVRAKLSAR